MHNSGIFGSRTLCGPFTLESTTLRCKECLFLRRSKFTNYSLHLPGRKASLVLMRISSFPFGVTWEFQASIVPGNWGWGGMAPKCTRLPALLVLLCSVGLGPAQSSDIAQPGRTHGHLRGQPCTDLEAFLWLCRPRHMLLVNSAVSCLPGRAHEWEPGLNPDRNPPKLLPFRHFTSSPCLSIFRDPPP